MDVGEAAWHQTHKIYAMQKTVAALLCMHSSRPNTFVENRSRSITNVYYNAVVWRQAWHEALLFIPSTTLTPD